jgi:hypothetical protein
MIRIGQGRGAEVTPEQLGPLGAFITLDAWDKRKAKELKGLSCKGTVVNA